ncbi:MAG: GNAT family N-acetyltransferase [Anaerolineae bacterium]
MVSQAISQANSSFSGLRPFNSSRDLGAVALLLEEAFREDLGPMHFWSRIPGLRQVGAQLWAASFAPLPTDLLLGVVWEEDRRIIGNVTLTLDESRRRHWLISNVAVAENYRRRGIARQMMEAAIQEAIARGAIWVILNVRPYNTGAVQLYNELGFRAVDTEMGYIRRRPARIQHTTLPLRRLKGDEHSAMLDIARAGMSDQLKLFRPLRPSEFAPNLEDRIAEHVTDFFIAQTTERWGFFRDGSLCAAVTLRGQHVGTPHSFDVRIHPEARGLFEDELLTFTLSRLARFPRRDLRTRVLTSNTALVEALGQSGFVQTRGLMLMAKQVGA